MKKRAQGLSMNTIVVAVIALTVLVILIFVFSGNLGKTSDNLASCKAKGGVCGNSDGSCPSGNPVKIIVSDKACENVDGLCCIKFGSN